jgi:hypothetical protein
MTYTPNGTLLTDVREVAESETWDTQTDWEAYQDASTVNVSNGSVELGSVLDTATGHWPGDEGSGTTLTDNIGSNDITLNGPTWQSVSRFEGGYGLSYDRTDDTASGSLQQPTSWTWMIRVAADSLGSDSPTYRTVISHDVDPFIVYSVGDEYWRFQDAGGSRIDINDSQSAVESEDRILCVRVDSTEALFEVFDGSKSLVGSASISNPDTTYSSSTTYLGAYADESRLWGGLMDPQFIQLDRYATDPERDALLDEY